MIKAEIEPGKEYAFREKRGPGVPLQRVKTIEHIRHNKWRAEWTEPNPGLVDYVEPDQLVALWKDAKRLIKEEENELGARVEPCRRNQLWSGRAEMVAGPPRSVVASHPCRRITSSQRLVRRHRGSRRSSRRN